MTPVQITHSVPPAWCGNEYTMSPFNVDCTRLLLIKVDHFGLFDGAGTFLSDLPIAASAEPRWSRKDPTIFYYLSGNSLFSYSTTTSLHLQLHVFTEYTSVSGKGESDIALDSNHMVFAGTRPDSVVEVFVFTISTGTKGPLFPQTVPTDGLKLDSQNLAIVSYSDGTGIWVLDNPPRKLAGYDGHSCPVTYLGLDKLLWDSSADPVINANAVVSIDVATGVVDILATFPWAYSFHISAPVNLPYCIVSTDCPDKSLPSQIWQVFFDKTIPPVLIADTGSIYTGYNSQIKAAISWDGSKIVGCSNFGQTADVNYCDAFLIDSAPVPVPDTSTRIDYSSYVGKSIFEMRPRPDGALDIYERKL
jgi:hypothetical protein